MFALYQKGIGETAQTLPKDYIEGCLRASSQLGIPPAHLHAVVLIEGGITALNKINSSGFGGLGQWGNPAARELGYSSVRALINANPTYLQQWGIMVTWIRRLINNYGKGKYLGPGFLYVCHFLPYNAKFYAQKNKVLYNSELKEYLRKGATTYNQNSSLDFDGNGEITIGDLDNLVLSKMRGLKTDYAQAPTNTGVSLMDVWNKGMQSITDAFTPQIVKDTQQYFGQMGKIFEFLDNYGQELTIIGFCFIGIKAIDYLDK
jgi:hypothetical protein